MEIIVNNRKIEAEQGETVLSALNRAGISVPTLCYLKDLAPSGACRMCVVEIEGMPNLVPSCSFPVSEGMKIHTHSAKANLARKTIVELLLSSHPNDCLYCSRSSNCDLSDLAREYGITDRLYPGEPKGNHVDHSSLSLERDPDKCILCGKCVRVCEEVQGVSALDFINRGSDSIVGCAFNEGLNVSSCINCGQCVMVCPTGALTERKYIKEVMEAIANPKKHVVIQHAPAISVSIAEEFGLPHGVDEAGKLTAALRQLGFDKVFDTSFTADLTIMEEASELVHRVSNGGTLPMMTSCSPGWVKFVETFYPDMIDNVSTCKSPQQMLGAIAKSYYAEKNNIDPADIVSVSIMPCTAKKFETSRKEMTVDGHPDLDYSLTTREIGEMIRAHGIDFGELVCDEADNPFGERTTAGKIFGASGGVMEAAYRTAVYLITGKNPETLDLEPVRGFDNTRKAVVKIGDLDVGVAVCSGLQNARKLLDEIKEGKHPDLHFIEVMTCPGGCINGGGQPFTTDREAVKARIKALYNLDSHSKARLSHENEHIQKLYKEYLGEPLGEKSHKLLHTHYHSRDDLVK
jgi:iron-only hydrogenase group A